MQAIALSLKDSTECSNVRPNEHSQSSNAHLSDNMINARKENAHIREDTGKRKWKKPVRFLLGLVVLRKDDGFYLFIFLMV